MTPLGFLPLLEAVERCAKAWSVSLPVAWSRLRPWLSAGVIDTCAVGADGASFSVGHDWAADRNERAAETGILLFEMLYDDGYIQKSAFVKKDDLEALLSGRLDETAPEQKAASAVSASTTLQIPTKKAKTRGPKAGHDAFWIEACRLIDKGECPPDDTTQAEFGRRMIRWMKENRPDLYDESTVLDKVKDLFRVLRPRG